MRKIIRTIVRRFWGLFAFVLCSFAVLVVIGRLVTPLIASYRDELTAAASARFGLNVQVEQLQATWEGLSPELLLEGITVNSPNGETVLSIASAVAKLDLVRSIFHLDWKWRILEFSDTYVPFHQDDQGVWRLVAVNTPGGKTFSLDDFLLLSNQVSLNNARFDFYFRTGHSTTVTFPNLLVESSGEFRRYSTRVDVDQQSDVLTFVVETRGDMRDQENFSAKGYLKLKNFDLDKAVAALPGNFWEGLPNQEWRKGHDLNLEVWFDIFTGNQILARGNINVGELPLTIGQGFTPPQSMAADFVFQWRNTGAWSVSLVNADLGWASVTSPTFNVLASSPELGGPVTVQVPEIDLSTWQNTLTEAQFFPAAATDIIQTLEPQGTIKNISVTINGFDVDDIEVKANLQDVSNSAWLGVPALTHVDGYVQSTLRQGFVEVDSRNGFSMFYQKVYDEPMVFDNAKGQVNWFIDYSKRHLTLYSGLLQANGDAGQGRGYFALNTPTYPNSGITTELQLQLGAYNSKAKYHKIFVPAKIPQSIRDWLNASVKSGRVPVAGFLYRGGVNHEAVKEASVQLFLDVVDADLQFDPNWPELKAANATLWLDNRHLSGKLNNGRLLSSTVGSTTIDVAQSQTDDSFLLAIKGRLTGGAGDGLHLLRETPIRNVVEDHLDSWRINGRLQTEFDLSIPLTADHVTVKPKIKATLRNTDLTIPDYNLSFAKLNGSIYYDPDHGVHFDKLSGNFLERPVTLSMTTLSERLDEEDAQSIKAGDVDFNEMRVRMQGDAAIDTIQQWLQRPELAFMEGQSRYEAELTIPFGKLRHDTVHVDVQSDLQGVAVSLPTPFAKPSDSTTVFTLHADIAPDRNQFAIQYGDNFNGLFQVRNGSLVDAGVGLNTEAVFGEGEQIYVRGHLNDLVWNEWTDVFNRYKQYRNAIDGGNLTPLDKLLPVVFELDLQHFQYDDKIFDDLTVAGKQSPDFWRFSVKAPLLAGDITWFENPQTPTAVDLQYLRLPEREEADDANNEFGASTAKTDPLADWNPAALPPLDFTTQEFSVGSENYGRWSFQMRPTTDGAIFTHLVSDIRGGHIVGPGEAEGATVHWTKTNELNQSSFTGRFVADNLADVFQQWNQPQMLESEHAVLNANFEWPGSPAMISLDALRGELNFSVDKGRFSKEEATGKEGILRLLGLLNFDTWARRVRLDFSDLYGKGLAFDTINGNMTFDAGKLYFTQPIDVTTPSSRLQMAGTIDIKQEIIDGTLVATLPVGGNLTLVSFFAGGLPAALGVYLVSKLFKDQVDKVASLSYRIQGSLDEFDIEFERLFDSKAAEKAGDKSRESMEANDGSE